MRRLSTAFVLVLVITQSTIAQQQQQGPATVFRISRDIISIDVVVRDRSGALVRGLGAADFEIREDGRPQEVLTTSFQEVKAAAAGSAREVPMLRRLGAPPAPPSAAHEPEVAGRRLILLLFDLSQMEPEEVERAVRAARQFVDRAMSPADLVAVATLTWELSVLTDFTSDPGVVGDILDSIVAVDVSTGDAAPADTADTSPLVERPTAATESRLRALRLLSDSLADVSQKKALLYFTAGLGNVAHDTMAELRAATTAAARANLAIYPVDTRGLRAVVPSGPARVASRSGEGLFSGSDVNDQFSELTASQDMMASVATATGGRMFHGANDLSEAFDRVARDTEAYYLLGYTTTNTARDGRFRRIQVRVKREGLRVEARAGYYAERDFAHTNREDREAQLEQQLLEPSPAADLRVEASTSWVRLADERFSVPITVTTNALATTPSDGADVLDLLAIIEDEQGRVVGRIRDTLDIPVNAAQIAPSVAYVTSAILPAGRFTLRTVVRQNVDGAMGSVSTEIRLPDLEGQTLAVSPPHVVDSENGRQIVTVDVYDATADARPLTASLTLFNDDEPIFDGEFTETTVTAARDRASRTFVLSLERTIIAAGRYVGQVTVVDPATGRFATMRLPMRVR